jgi:hypothetical protein
LKLLESVAGCFNSDEPHSPSRIPLESPWLPAGVPGHEQIASARGALWAAKHAAPHIVAGGSITLTSGTILTSDAGTVLV